MKTLNERLCQSFSDNADSYAIDVLDCKYTHKQVQELSFTYLSALNCVNSYSRFVGIFAYRSINTYTGIIATLFAGRGYMPINPKFPVERIAQMLALADCDTIILSEECEASFALIAEKTKKLTVICAKNASILQKKYPQHQFVNISTEKITTDIANVSPDRAAYLLFTSGSTGTPKGVTVSHKNLLAYIDYTIKRYDFNKTDIFTQMFDTSFDLSVHDIFISLLTGATLCVIPEKHTMAPAKFIKEKKITVWFSVPAVIMFMSKLGMLKQGAFPALRYSLFCGEALPMTSVENWQQAAPNSIIENLYGPTEATISITNYRWDSNTSPAQCVNGIVPIGNIFEGQNARVLNDKLHDVPKGMEGELCVSGSQITDGYLHNKNETAKRFVHIDNEIWYRTGDLVRETGHGFVYLGRLDDQVQLRGHRIELQEIDKVLRDGICNDMAVAVPISLPNSQTVDTIYGFIEAKQTEIDLKQLEAHCKKHLPEYMIPSKFIIVDKLPLNSNGKIDKKELATWK